MTELEFHNSSRSSSSPPQNYLARKVQGRSCNAAGDPHGVASVYAALIDEVGIEHTQAVSASGSMSRGNPRSTISR
jgi:hypothetical protein